MCKATRPWWLLLVHIHTQTQQEGIHHSRLGNSPLHSLEGIPTTHDKSPTHTESLACLPLQPLHYRECLCRYVLWTATFTTQHCPQTERKQRDVGEASYWGKKKKRKGIEVTRTCLCQTAMPQMCWSDWWEGSLCWRTSFIFPPPLGFLWQNLCHPEFQGFSLLNFLFGFLDSFF